MQDNVTSVNTITENQIKPTPIVQKRAVESDGVMGDKPLPTNFDEITFSSTTHKGEKKFASNTPVKVAIVGNVDSGKSTLCGYLTKGIPDDGRGSARLRVFNYPHEASNGRTSSVAQEIMGWDEKGIQQFAERFVQNKNKYWSEVVSKSSKFVSLIDLCGHEKYLKTTMLGMVGLVPDYAMVIVGANMGLSKMTKEHIGISLAIKLPFFVVVTKTDMVEKVVLEKTLDDLKKILKTNAVNRKPLMITSEAEVQKAAEAILTDKICPIFAVSSVTGESMNLLTRFLFLIQSRNHINSMIGGIDEPAEVDIHERFTVTGIGLVVSGTLKSGTVKVGQIMLCGPDKFKKFRPVVIKSLHVNRVSVEEAQAGSFVCCAIRSTNKKEELSKEDFRKGMCLLDPALEPAPAWEFDAEVVVLHHSTTIKEGYQSVMHCGVVRQSVNIQKMSKSVLRAKDSAQIRFRFMYHPEYLKKDSTILLREGRTKILGVITHVYPGEKLAAEPTLQPIQEVLAQESN
jgi:GTPase